MVNSRFCVVWPRAGPGSTATAPAAAAAPVISSRRVMPVMDASLGGPIWGLTAPPVKRGAAPWPRTLPRGAQLPRADDPASGFGGLAMKLNRTGMRIGVTVLAFGVSLLAVPTWLE